jgi:hypothetical protein
LRLAEDAPIKFSLTGTGRGGEPLDLNIKKRIKINLFRMPDDSPITVSLTGMVGAVDLLRSKLKKLDIKIRNWAWQRKHRLNFL